jgi:hypothetical protein
MRGAQHGKFAPGDTDQKKETCGLLFCRRRHHGAGIAVINS